jgi:hypothetical protein
MSGSRIFSIGSAQSSQVGRQAVGVSVTGGFAHLAIAGGVLETAEKTAANDGRLASEGQVDQSRMVCFAQ